MNGTPDMPGNDDYVYLDNKPIHKQYLRQLLEAHRRKPEDKILRTSGDLANWARSVKSPATRLVVTNGCFDLLHRGHVEFLDRAARLGDYLLVGINDDASVRALKGPDRPVVVENDRARVLCALECVDAVFIFSGLRATDFLAAARPDIWVKGGYSMDTLDPEEVRTAGRVNAAVVTLPAIDAEYSTTSLIARIAQRASK